MAEEQKWRSSFDNAVEVVRRGDFDEVKAVMEVLDFVFEQTGDPNHWMYYHPRLRGDPHFRYPRNLYRPHGSRRGSGRISRHDQSQAKQIIEALRGVLSSSQESGEGYQ